ncbi:hypothetical protein D3C76_826900 [compost metagenome]
MKDVEFVLAAGAPCLHVHALEQVGVALGVEDNHHLLGWPVDVLGDVDLRQARLADPGGAQHQGVPNTLTQRQGGFLLTRLDAVQQRRAPDWWQRTHRIERVVPGGEAGQQREP